MRCVKRVVRTLLQNVGSLRSGIRMHSACLPIMRRFRGLLSSFGATIPAVIATAATWHSSTTDTSTNGLQAVVQYADLRSCQLHGLRPRDWLPSTTAAAVPPASCSATPTATVPTATTTRTTTRATPTTTHATNHAATWAASAPATGLAAHAFALSTRAALASFATSTAHAAHGAACDTACSAACYTISDTTTSDTTAPIASQRHITFGRSVVSASRTADNPACSEQIALQGAGVCGPLHELP